jgi:hypothetical protein
MKSSSGNRLLPKQMSNSTSAAASAADEWGAVLSQPAIEENH